MKSVLDKQSSQNNYTCVNKKPFYFFSPFMAEVETGTWVSLEETDSLSSGRDRVKLAEMGVPGMPLAWTFSLSLPNPPSSSREFGMPSAGSASPSRLSLTSENRKTDFRLGPGLKCIATKIKQPLEQSFNNTRFASLKGQFNKKKLFCHRVLHLDVITNIWFLYYTKLKILKNVLVIFQDKNNHLKINVLKSAYQNDFWRIMSHWRLKWL